MKKTINSEKSRTYNSIVNSIFGIVSSAITIVLNFFVRVVLVHQLGVEINGLHTLFQSIINVMAIMELGINSAMIIHLYEPIKKHDELLIKGIMSFYRRIYQLLALVFSVCVLLVSFVLLDSIISTTIDKQVVRVYFLLFGLASILNYLTYYKRSILFAEQNNRISIAATAGCEVLFRGLQILFLITTHSYVVFLILWIIEKVSSNIICSIYVNKHHPYLMHNHEILKKEKKEAIFATIKPLFVNQVAGTVGQSAKSILSSMLLGNISIVGYYGNYQLVISMVEMIYSQFGGAITSSFGNLAVEGDKERLRSAYKRSTFIMNWIACYMCAGFYVCIQDFIQIVFTKQSILAILSVVSLLANLIIYLVNIPIISIQNAMGLHRLDAIAMVIQSAISIALAYIGGLFFDMPGIFFGLLIPIIVLTTFRKGIIISGYALDMTSMDYALYICKEIMKIIVAVVITGLACSYVKMPASILSIFVKGFIAILICSITTPILSLKSMELSFTLSLIKRYLPMNKRR